MYEKYLTMAVTLLVVKLFSISRERWSNALKFIYDKHVHYDTRKFLCEISCSNKSKLNSDIVFDLHVVCNRNKVYA